MTMMIIITTSVLCGLGMWCAVYFITRPRGLQITVQDNLTGLKSFNVIAVGKKVVKSMASKTKKEAIDVLTEKRERFMDQGFLVGKVQERSDHVFFAHQKDEHLTTTSIGFAPPKPEYPLGTMGYAWQDGASERYLKKLLRMEDGGYVCVRSHPGCVNSYWDNFSPLDIYGELAEVNLAFDSLVKTHSLTICPGIAPGMVLEEMQKNMAQSLRQDAARRISLK